MVSLNKELVESSVFGQALATSVLGTQNSTLEGGTVSLKIFLMSVESSVFWQALATSVFGAQNSTLEGGTVSPKIFLMSVESSVFGQALATSVLGDSDCAGYAHIRE